jgi:hypothetical protein
MVFRSICGAFCQNYYRKGSTYANIARLVYHKGVLHKQTWLRFYNVDEEYPYISRLAYSRAFNTDRQTRLRFSNVDANIDAE